MKRFRVAGLTYYSKSMLDSVHFHIFDLSEEKANKISIPYQNVLTEHNVQRLEAVFFWWLLHKVNGSNI